MAEPDLVKDLEDLPGEMLEALAGSIRSEHDRRRRADPVSYFPWHGIQTWVLDAPELCENPVRIILVAGGNRGGKTKVGMGTWAKVIRRESALNNQFTTTDPVSGRVMRKTGKHPLVTWVVPPTLEKARLDWLNPSDQMGLKFWAGDLFLHHRETPDNVLYTKMPGYEGVDGMGKIRTGETDQTIMKSQDQKLESFESSEVDLILVDEELQSTEKWSSMLMRIATTNGVIMMTFTPLHGLSWSFDKYWKPLVKLGRAQKMGERCWVHDPKKSATVICAQIGARDNPRARAYADEIEGDMSMTDAEKAARLEGEYGYVEGALIPALSGLDLVKPDADHHQYIVDALPGDRVDGKKVPGRIQRYLLVSDPNKSYGAILAGVDTDGNVFFLSDHLETSWPSQKHASAFRKMENKYAKSAVERYADPGAAGAQAIVEMEAHGLHFENVRKEHGSVSASIKSLRGLTYVDPDHRHPITGEMGAPRLYFYRPGMVSRKVVDGVISISCLTAEQISEARQTDDVNAAPDTPHKTAKSRLDLFDCARYIAHIVASGPTPHEDPHGARVENPENTLTIDDDEDEDDGSLIWTPQYDNGGAIWTR